MCFITMKHMSLDGWIFYNLKLIAISPDNVNIPSHVSFHLPQQFYFDYLAYMKFRCLSALYEITFMLSHIAASV